MQSIRSLPLLLILLIMETNSCISITPSSNIVFFVLPKPNPVKTMKKIPIWIKVIEKSDSYRYHFWKNHNIDTTYAIYRFIRDLRQFEKVNIYYSQQIILPENAILLEFFFSKLEEKDELGGSLYILRLEYKGNLIAYNSLNQEIARTPLSLQENCSNKTDADQKRKEMLEVALQNLLTKLGEK